MYRKETLKDFIFFFLLAKSNKPRSLMVLHIIVRSQQKETPRCCIKISIKTSLQSSSLALEASKFFSFSFKLEDLTQQKLFLNVLKNIFMTSIMKHESLVRARRSEEKFFVRLRKIRARLLPVRTFYFIF